MGEFSMFDLLGKREAEEEEESQEEGYLLTLDAGKLVPSKDNHYSCQQIDAMKESIQLVGIEQPLRVEPMDDGSYMILAGHRRQIASLELAKEDDSYQWIPCFCKAKKSDNLSKLTLYLTNSTQRAMTDYDRMIEAVGIEAEIKELKRNNKIPGRTRELTADALGIKPSQLGRYHTITNNLSSELMEAFRQEKFGISVALVAASLPAAYQMAAYGISEDQELTLQIVEGLKQKSEEQTPGQMEIEELGNQEADKKEWESDQNDHVSDEEKQGLDQEDQKADQEDYKADQTDQKADRENQEPDQEPDQEPEEPQPVIYVREEPEKRKGCGLCNSESGELTTKDNLFGIFFDPINKKFVICNKDTGETDTIVFPRCPICGERV